MNMSFKKSLALLAALIMVLSALTACAGTTAPAAEATATEAPAATAEAAATEAPAEPETIVFWHTYSEGEEQIFLNEIVPAFEAANPGIKVDAVRMPVDGLQQQVITAASGNAAPDVMRMDITWVSQLGNRFPYAFV